MRKMLILLALAILTTTSGCSRCRNLFRRGSPCGGTALAAPAMLGGAVPIGRPMHLPQAMMAQPNCCQQSAPICCDACPADCRSCGAGNSGYVGQGYASQGYVSGGGDCGCQSAPVEYFGGYEEGSAPISDFQGEATQDSSLLPHPTN